LGGIDGGFGRDGGFEGEGLVAGGVREGNYVLGEGDIAPGLEISGWGEYGYKKLVKRVF